MKFNIEHTAERRNRLHPLLTAGGSFQCKHCRQHVLVDVFFSGVQNRNHCPYCLWSRHLDLFQAGDRLSACKGSMQPIGLTAKRTRNKYAHDAQGELMLVHRCEECGKLSANRLAADDDPALVLRVYEESHERDGIACQTQGIQLLARADRALVEMRLFGRISLPAERLLQELPC